jgi:phenylalanyl-tRNA synthetase alpha chain
MLNTIERLLEEAKEFKAESLEELDALRIKHLSKKGTLAQLFDEFRMIPAEQKREVGQTLNKAKVFIQERINELKESLSDKAEKTESNDISLPGEAINLGSRHPISIIRKEILEIFSRIGFSVSRGPEIEDDWHVFFGIKFSTRASGQGYAGYFFH